MSELTRFKTSITRAKPNGKSSIANTLSRKPPRTELGLDRDSHSDVILTRSERMNHTHVIGSTGTGKSKLMELMLRRDVIDRRAGVCLIDPHGSLYEDMVTYVSHRYPNHADRIILFNPANELENIVGFNPIPSPVEHIDYLLDSLISGCLKAWGQDNTDDTPRISKWLENIFYTIIANDLTWVESAPLLNIYSKEQRSVLLQKVGSEMVRDDWKMFEDSNVNQKQSLIEGAANRLRKFLRNEIIRNIIGQQNSSLDFESIMNEGKVVLINLNGQGRISHDNAKLLGIMLVNEIFRCAKLRDPRDPLKKPFFFYIDEFANFVTRDVARSLEESRKFGLFLTLSHQHLSQLETEDEYLYGSVMTNCKNKVVFGGLSHQDAELMMKEVSSGFMNLKQIKDTMMTKKERHVPEKKLVRNWSESKNKGFSWSFGKSKSEGATVTKGSSQTVGTSESNTRTTGSSSGTSTSTNTGSNRSATRSGDRRSQESGSSFGHSSGHSHSASESQSHGVTTSQSETVNESTGHSKTTGTSETDGGSRSKGKSKGVSETWVTIPKEYEEISSKTFWSLAEIEHMETAMIKNQGVAQAFIKVGHLPPKKVNIARIKDIPYNPRNYKKRIDTFRENVFKSHHQYYKKAHDILLESQKRQIKVFGRPLEYESHKVDIIAVPNENTENPSNVADPDASSDSPFA